MRNLCKVLLLLVIGSILLFSGAYSESKNITKTFEKKKLIKLSTIAGDCIIKQSEKDNIEVTVINDYSPKDSFEAEFQERKNALRMKEQIYDSNMGSSKWIITAPPETEIEFSSASGGMNIENYKGDISGNTASGDYEITNCEGYFDLNTASGNYYIENCRGEFSVNSASGSIDASGITILEESNFGSASGNVKLELGASPEFDLNIGSASGKAVLDFNGNPMKGLFEMSSRDREGRIDAPFEFDEIKHYRKSDEKYIIKSVIKEVDQPLISIGTSSGRAILIK
jgi:DUF4097 and DUF4098 domain-containing protein YvlB